MPQYDILDDSGSVVLTKKEKEKVEYLVRIISALKIMHYSTGKCIHPDDEHIVPDSEFDAMVKELAKLDPDALKNLGNLSAGKFDPNAKKMKHDPPMTSINKANGKPEEKIEEFEKWLKIICAETGWTHDDALKHIVVSFKHDGIAGSVKYENGKLVQAGLRPDDGVNGEDVTLNVKYVKGAPQTLPLPLTCIIRGEFECLKSVFQKKNTELEAKGEETYANPRNYATGSIRQFKDPTVTGGPGLSFAAYNIIGLDKPPYKGARERAIWANKNLGINFVRIEAWTPTLFDEMEAMVPNLDYEVDGAVAEVDEFDVQDQLGTYGKQINSNPRGKIAYKFKDEEASPVINNIQWQIGRSGIITPVAEFQGVSLAGTIVKRATAFSLGFLVRNNIHEKTKIRIRKSGKIIPEVLGHFNDQGKFVEKIDAGDVDLPASFDLSKFNYPLACPSCGKPTKTATGAKRGLIDLICDNSECPARNVQWFVNYLDKFGIKGIGEATVTELVENGLLKRLSDFYTLNVTDLRAIGGSIRESLLTIAQIHMIEKPEQIKDNKVLGQRIINAIGRKKGIALSKFISCLGIPGVSKGTGNALSKQFGNWDSILAASEADLTNTPDIGAKTATSLAIFFKLHHNDLEELITKHVELELPKQGKYTGTAWVFTGSPGPEGKDHFKSLVEQHGGIVKSSVTKDITHVVIGEDAGSKADKAKEMKAKGHSLTIIDSYNDLKKMLE